MQGSGVLDHGALLDNAESPWHREEPPKKKGFPGSDDRGDGLNHPQQTASSDQKVKSHRSQLRDIEFEDTVEQAHTKQYVPRTSKNSRGRICIGRKLVNEGREGVRTSIVMGGARHNLHFLSKKPHGVSNWRVIACKVHASA